MKLVIIALVSLIVSSSPFEQSDSEQEVRSVLEGRDEQIKELLGPKDQELGDDKREELRIIVNEMMDYHEMGRFALSDTYYELDTEQQDEFVELFAKIIRDQSLQQLNIYRAEVIYDNIEVSDNKALVSTTAILEDNRIPVHYRMRKKEEGWVIVDMSIDEAWTAESYQRSFQNIIRRRGFDALIENLRRRAEESG